MRSACLPITLPELLTRTLTNLISHFDLPLCASNTYPFLMIFVPFESWDRELSNAIKIIKNGTISRELRSNWIFDIFIDNHTVISRRLIAKRMCSHPLTRIPYHASLQIDIPWPATLNFNNKIRTLARNSWGRNDKNWIPFFSRRVARATLF